MINKGNCSLIIDYCGHHGVCVDNSCQCLPFYSGSRCNTSYYVSLGKIGRVWDLFFIISFGLVLSNLLFLIINPFGKRELKNQIYLQLFGGFGIFFIFSSYLLVLVYWISLYHRSYGDGKNGIKSTTINPSARNFL
ncbi:hypothetical protein DICPUDRAFT_78404 [Dictyostelium purpureum]|uniref:EGF-like domain-containing protein n=1 Tax=Dictyostelium purpureum TaxID=5786 RepID=F0ZJG1_DICPU|nr:uncharacterized protein DICPUDRAFT_78404 [Dictyostelium purpureum]EGC35914.1 hypothetical protein DICPUDRAFT_78404 [Dictyostelium purpureum]|eukprot:XP_003287568.1 hypothetical protein DICPUDRAFT_78404 [Dictyostelium purpureum]